MFLVNKGHYLAPKTTQIFISCAIEAAWCTGSAKNCLKAKGPFPGGQPIPVWLVHASLCDFQIPKLEDFLDFWPCRGLSSGLWSVQPKDGLVWPFKLGTKWGPKSSAGQSIPVWLVHLSLCDLGRHFCSKCSKPVIAKAGKATVAFHLLKSDHWATGNHLNHCHQWLWWHLWFQHQY